MGPISRCRQHSGFKDRDVSGAVRFSEKKKRGALPDAEKAPKALMETEWTTRTMGVDGAGVISPYDVVATIWAGITHKCLLIREHTATPITFFLLSRGA